VEHISLSKDDLREFKIKIDRINNFKGLKTVSAISEIETPQRIKEFRRACYLKKDIKKGEKITQELLITLRPNLGIDAKDYFNLIGCEAKINLKQLQI